MKKNFTSRTKSARLLVAAFATVLLLVPGILWLGQRDKPAAPVLPSSQPAEARNGSAPAPTGIARTSGQEAETRGITPDAREATGLPAIVAFRQWAEAAAASGFAGADQDEGMELAKARSAAMKALIQKDPASALRLALPAELRVSLPIPIAAAIEQPVKTTGLCSMRMMCSHSDDSPHGNCETAPVLLEDVISWNAHYGEQQWKSHLGQTVGFDGIAVDEELAVQSITPVPPQQDP